MLLGEHDAKSIIFTENSVQYPKKFKFLENDSVISDWIVPKKKKNNLEINYLLKFSEIFCIDCFQYKMETLKDMALAEVLKLGDWNQRNIPLTLKNELTHQEKL